MSEPLDLEPIKARIAAATPGEWMCWSGWGPLKQDGLMRCTRIGPVWNAGGIAVSAGGADLCGTRGDIEFAAAASFDIPALVAEVEGLRALLSRVADLDGAARAALDLLTLSGMVNDVLPSGHHPGAMLRAAVGEEPAHPWQSCATAHPERA